MLKNHLKSTSVKLFILLGIIVVMFITFTALYAKDYVSYYVELYDYRQDLLTFLTGDEVKKPAVNPDDPIKGNPRAKIVIIEYGDFSCEACRAIQPTLKQIEGFYGLSNILFVWKDLPVTVAPNNMLAHQAAHCAADQEAFYDFKDTLYKNQGNFNNELFIEIAQQLNLDVERFTQCMESESKRGVVERNLLDALEVGIDGAPTLFVNNTEVRSGFNVQNIRNIIESTR